MRLLLGLVGLVLAGCQAEPVAGTGAAATPQSSVIAAGTPVKLVLLDELTSGGSDKGATVHLALAEPAEGLPVLSPATATVAWSRTEGTLGGLSNRPARLNVTLKNLTGPNGEEIPLSADPKEPKDYEFNRTNTGRPESNDPGEENEEAQKAVQELVRQGQSGGLDPKQVGELAKRLGMSETSKLVEADRLNEVGKLFQTVRGGGSLAALASGAPVAAALELVNLAGDVGHRMGRRFGGRNIRAYPGTIVQAYVARETTIKAQ